MESDAQPDMAFQAFHKAVAAVAGHFEGLITFILLLILLFFATVHHNAPLFYEIAARGVFIQDKM